jgi:alkylated DNA repair dioxygenase AlkB
MTSAHYESFIAGTRSRRAARGVVRIELPGMVVVMGGHQRAFFGHVYLTDRVPPGFAPKDLRQGSP